MGWTCDPLSAVYRRLDEVGVTGSEQGRQERVVAVCEDEQLCGGAIGGKSESGGGLQRKLRVSWSKSAKPKSGSGGIGLEGDTGSV